MAHSATWSPAPSFLCYPPAMTVRWGILGCGSVCEVKSGPPLRQVAGSEIAVVMRRDAAKAEDYARRHGVRRWTTDAAAVLSDPAVNAVYVATPPDSHASYALACAEAGKPCYVEKPMARHTPECERMLTAFGEAGLPLFVAYYRRALPRFLHVATLLRERRIGTPLTVTVRYSRHRSREDVGWRFEPERSGGGLLMDLGSHTLDVLDFLLGPIETVTGEARRMDEGPGVEDTVVACGAFQGGPLLSAAWSFAADEHRDEIEIAGERGRISLSTFGDGPVVVTTDRGSESFQFTNPAGIHSHLVETIVAELNGKRGACPSTGRSALRTSRALDAILAGYYDGRSDAFWLRAPGRGPETSP